MKEEQKNQWPDYKKRENPAGLLAHVATSWREWIKSKRRIRITLCQDRQRSQVGLLCPWKPLPWHSKTSLIERFLFSCDKEMELRVLLKMAARIPQRLAQWKSEGFRAGSWEERRREVKRISIRSHWLTEKVFFFSFSFSVSQLDLIEIYFLSFYSFPSLHVPVSHFPAESSCLTGVTSMSHLSLQTFFFLDFCKFSMISLFSSLVSSPARMRNIEDLKKEKLANDT